MAFIPQDDEPQEDKLGTELPQDNGTPFSPPATPANDPGNVGQPAQSPVLDDTHPATDSNIDTDEVYESNLPGAAEASEPNTGNAVTGYHPEKDEREQAA